MYKQRAASGQGKRRRRGGDEVSGAVPSVMAMSCERESFMAPSCHSHAAYPPPPIRETTYIDLPIRKDAISDP